MGLLSLAAYRTAFCYTEPLHTSGLVNESRDRIETQGSRDGGFTQTSAIHVDDVREAILVMKRTERDKPGFSSTAIQPRESKHDAPDAADEGNTLTSPTASAAKPGRMHDIARYYLVPLLIPLEIVIFSIASPHNFASVATLQTLLTTNAALLVIATGQTLILIVGEFDLSFAGTVGLAGCMMVVLHGASVGVSLITSLAAVLAFGLLNAFFVVILGVNSLIATLGMGTVTTGVAIAASNGQTVPNPYTSLGSLINHRWLGISVSFYVAVLGILLLWGVLERTAWGRNAYFVGAGRRAAAYAGIKVNRSRVLAFAISAFSGWLAGMILFGQSGSADSTFGSDYLLTVIAAVFLGYTAIKPGRFNALGTLVGMLVLAIGTTGIEVLAAPIWLTDVFSGAILFVAVALANVLGSARGMRALRSAVE